jgi:hypothetical protein
MKALALAALVIFSSSAFAKETVKGATSQGQQQQQNSTSDSVAEAVNAGNSQTIIFQSGGDSTQRVEYGTQRIKNTPSMNPQPLTSSNDTCMGSASGAVNAPGFGFGFGKTYIDSNCVMLKNSREFWNMGMRAAALARMCMDSDNKEALEITGFECPQTTRTKSQQAAGQRPDVTDPYVRSRMGLAPLSK